jgi:hypothetical protein
MYVDRMSGQELVDYYAIWLAPLKWQWYGSLSFRRHRVPFWMAERCFHTWIGEIETALGKNQFCWFRFNNFGAFPTEPFFYVLVGGMRTGSKYVWMNRWQAIAGDADIEYFHRHDRASRFIVGIARPGFEFEISAYQSDCWIRGTRRWEPTQVTH